MPRVIQILNRLIIGGPAIIAVSLTHYLQPEYETMLVIGGKDDHEQDATHLTDRFGITPVEIPEMKRAIRPGQDRKAYLKMKQLMQDFKPDIVHTHAAKSGAIGRLAAFSCNVPVVTHTFHGHVFHSYFNKITTQGFINIERYLARRSSGIISISDIQKSELADTYKICPADKIKTIELGLDIDKFATNTDLKRKTFRNLYGIKDGEIAIGIIGRMAPVKNHTLFVEAAARVQAKVPGKVRFIIIGDGDTRAQTEGELKQAGLDYAYWPEEQRAATVIGTSWLTEIDEVLAGLDIVALTSHNEGTPVSLIEAQAASRPVVSTNVGGVADIVTEGIAGFITPPGNTDAFAGALLKLVNDADMCRRFGAAGRAFAEERFSMKRMVQETSNYYQSLLEKKKHSVPREVEY